MFLKMKERRETCIHQLGRMDVVSADAAPSAECFTMPKSYNLYRSRVLNIPLMTSMCFSGRQFRCVLMTW